MRGAHLQKAGAADFSACRLPWRAADDAGRVPRGLGADEILIAVAGPSDRAVADKTLFGPVVVYPENAALLRGLAPVWEFRLPGYGLVSLWGCSSQRAGSIVV